MKQERNNMLAFSAILFGKQTPFTHSHCHIIIVAGTKNTINKTFCKIWLGKWSFSPKQLKGESTIW